MLLAALMSCRVPVEQDPVWPHSGAVRATGVLARFGWRDREACSCVLEDWGYNQAQGYNAFVAAVDCPGPEYGTALSRDEYLRLRFSLERPNLRAVSGITWEVGDLLESETGSLGAAVVMRHPDQPMESPYQRLVPIAIPHAVAYRACGEGPCEPDGELEDAWIHCVMNL